MLHRLWPARFLAARRIPDAVRCQAAAAYEVIAELCYLDQDMALGVLAGLRSLNLAEAAGPSPERTRSYAVMCIVASLIPCAGAGRGLQPAGDRPPPRPASDLNARAWVLELTGINDLGDGRWDRGRQRLEQAVALSRRIGDWRRWEESLGELARLIYFQGAFEASASPVRADAGSGAGARPRAGPDVGAAGRSKSLLRLGRLAEAAALLEESPAVRGEPVGAADAILGLGLLATLRRLQGDWPAARRAAEATLDWIGRTQPIVNYSLEGYTGAAETFLGLWERGGFRWGYEQRDLERQARRACAALRRFARIFPLGRPRSWLCRGLLQWLSGHPARARSLVAARPAGGRADGHALRAGAGPPGDRPPPGGRRSRAAVPPGAGRGAVRPAGAAPDLARVREALRAGEPDAPSIATAPGPAP